MKAFRIGLWIVAGILAGTTIALFLVYRGGGTAVAEGPYGAPFQLVDQSGEPVTQELLRGEPSAVFFGFTHCPEVCPTTLFELASYQKQIAEEDGAFRIVFVTVDPERDTPEILKNYVESMSDDVTALTGEPDAVAAMLKGWGIYSRKVGEGADYTMDHTATTFLIDGNGALQGTIGYGENPQTAKQKLERLAGV